MFWERLGQVSLVDIDQFFTIRAEKHSDGQILLHFVAELVTKAVVLMLPKAVVKKDHFRFSFALGKKSNTSIGKMVTRKTLGCTLSLKNKSGDSDHAESFKSQQSCNQAPRG